MTRVTTHLRTADDDAVVAALAAAGLEPGSGGPLLVVLDAPVAPRDVAAVLCAWIAAARGAMANGRDVVTVLSDDHLEGDDVGRLSVGHGVVAATRAYAFEGERDDLRANVVVGPSTAAPTLRTAAWVTVERTVTGQVLLAGDPLHGRQRP